MIAPLFGLGDDVVRALESIPAPLLVGLGLYAVAHAVGRFRREGKARGEVVVSDRPAIPIPSWLPILLTLVTVGVGGVVYIKGVGAVAAAAQAATTVNATALSEVRGARLPPSPRSP